MIKCIFNNNISLLIQDDVVKTMFQHCQHMGECEAGGILLGKKEIENQSYEISELTVPSRVDKRGPFFFVRNKEKAQRYINSAWERSEGIVNYLGEWHTHCCKDPLPSIVDQRLMIQLFREKSNVFPCIFMIIVGTDRSLYIGQGDQEVGKIIDFRQIRGG